MTWAQSVKARDNYKCVACGAIEHLEAHHIVEKHINPDIKNNINNGITLCRKCHRAAHNGSFNPKGGIITPLEVNPLKVNRAIDEKMQRETESGT